MVVRILLVALLLSIFGTVSCRYFPGTETEPMEPHGTYEGQIVIAGLQYQKFYESIRATITFKPTSSERPLEGTLTAWNEVRGKQVYSYRLGSGIGMTGSPSEVKLTDVITGRTKVLEFSWSPEHDVVSMAGVIYTK